MQLWRSNKPLLRTVRLNILLQTGLCSFISSNLHKDKKEIFKLKIFDIFVRWAARAAWETLKDKKKKLRMTIKVIVHIAVELVFHVSEWAVMI